MGQISKEKEINDRKKENRQMAQERRAQERKRKEQKEKAKKFLMIGLPILIVALFIAVIIVDAVQRAVFLMK